MNIFEKVFNFISNLSTKMPDIDFKTYFIVVIAILVGICLICAISFLFSKIFKLKSACVRIRNFLKEVECIDDDNAGLFTEKCFTKKSPQSLRDAWIEYSGVRFGYPSEIVSEKNVFDKELGKTNDIRAKIFLSIGLIVLAFFSFWGYGKLASNEIGVIQLVGLILIGVCYFVLVILNKKINANALAEFEVTQEDLDAKVDMQIERDFATDSSPLLELASLVDEIIGRNTEKEIIQQQEETPIESLIRSQMEASQEENKELDTQFPQDLTDFIESSQGDEDEQESFLDNNELIDNNDEFYESEITDDAFGDYKEELNEDNNEPIESSPSATMLTSGEESLSENTMREKRVDVSMKGKSENLSNALNFNYDVDDKEKKEWIELDSANADSKDSISNVDIAEISELINNEEKSENSKESKYAKLLGVMDYISKTKTSQQMKDQIVSMLEEVANKKGTRKSDIKIIEECINKLKK